MMPKLSDLIVFIIKACPDKEDVASRTESKKLNNFSNLKSIVCELCRISLYVIERHRDASKLGIFN